MEKSELRELFEREYPGKRSIFDNLIQPIFSKAKDTTLTDNQILSESDKKLVKSFSIIAQVRGGFPIVFADVEVKDTVALRRSRVNIQNCVRKMMENDSNAIIFFHFTDNKNEWRVSYCHRATTNKETTDAKRFTYLCGTGHACKTVAQRFETLQGLTTIKDENMLEAFGVEPLSKEFFDRYRDQYANLVEYISGKKFVKKGGKFVEEKTGKANAEYKNAFDSDDKAVRDFVKKMMGRLVFLHFLQKKGWLGVKKGEDWGTGDRNFIFNLFANADESIKADFLEQALEPLFFKTLNTDRGEEALAPKAVCDIYGQKIRIPYLNGGLFEEDELDKKQVKFKKEHFESLLDFFNQYNFTIDETDPDDQEIGVDPEMLGKIFENLLEDNKDKGAFYTPKEIVQYMCRESLIAYLSGKLKIDNEDNKVRTFVLSHDASLLSKGDQAAILKALLDVKICDPAVGSGAFPMGMMNELLACMLVLTGEAKTRSDLKKHIVKNNIYGVDIEKGAVDIARLRFWLAIIVDEEKPLPLPNLDYKIMQGNSLLECYNGIDLSHMLEAPASGEFDYNEEQRTLLKTNMDEYFDDNNHKDKTAKNDIIKSLVYDLANVTCGLKKNSDIAHELHEKIWNGTTDFFLWHTWFSDVFNRPNDCNGFDIVIGNPPYRIVPSDDRFKSIYDRKYSVAHGGKRNLYHLFFEQGTKLLRNDGVLSYITPDTYFSGNDTTSLRKYFVDNTNIKKIIHYTEKDKVFENVTQAVAVVIMLKQKHKEQFTILVDGRTEIIHFSNLTKENSYIFKNSNSVIEQMKKSTRTFGDVCEGYKGDVNLALKKDFFTTKKTTKTLPLIRGIQISKYGYNAGNEYCSKEALSKDHTQKERIVFQEVANMGLSQRTKGTILKDVICGDSCNLIFSKMTDIDNRFILAILNCKAVNYFFKFFNQTNHVPIGELKKIPFPESTLSQRQAIIAIVDKILSAKKNDPHADTSKEEAKIDSLVYELYALNEEEIAVIEG